MAAVSHTGLWDGDDKSWTKCMFCQTIYSMILSNGAQFLEHQGSRDVTCQHFYENDGAKGFVQD